MVDARTAAADRARTPLLALISAEALEKDYQDAVRRRGGRVPSPESRLRTHAGVVVVVAGFGLMVAIAAAQTTQNADTSDASRAQLISRIESNRAALQSEQSALAELRQDNSAADAGLTRLTGDLNELRGAVTAVEASSGFAAVTGEGIRIRFDNLDGSDPWSDWVRDSDLAALVNGLWVAGAEAVAVNGQRITAVGGIRNVGTTVEINGHPLAPPYVVHAIGDSDTLSAELLLSESGSGFFNLASQYGWAAETVTMPEVRIPAAPGELRQLRSAHQLDENGKEGAQ